MSTEKRKNKKPRVGGITRRPLPDPRAWSFSPSLGEWVKKTTAQLAYARRRRGRNRQARASRRINRRRR